MKDGEVWELRSRNLLAGVWVEERQGFIGIRTKFGDRYLFMEYHWDTGAPYGTANPVKFLEQAPEDLDLVEVYKGEDAWHLNVPLFKYLEEVEKKYKVAERD